jgi:hypothetical protein
MLQSFPIQLKFPSRTAQPKTDPNKHTSRLPVHSRTEPTARNIGPRYSTLWVRSDDSPPSSCARARRQEQTRRATPRRPHRGDQNSKHIDSGKFSTTAPIASTKALTGRKCRHGQAAEGKPQLSLNTQKRRAHLASTELLARTNTVTLTLHHSMPIPEYKPNRTQPQSRKTTHSIYYSAS